MFRKNESGRCAGLLIGSAIEKYVVEDMWRQENNFFGVKYMPDSTEGVVVFLGARSGLEIVRLLKSHPACKIYVLEKNELLCQEIFNSLKNAYNDKWIKRVFFHQSISGLLDSLEQRVIDFLRVDLRAFDAGSILDLIDEYEIVHVCGEFDPIDIDPMKMYRACKARVKSYYWRIYGKDVAINGGGKAFDYDVSVVVPCYKVLPWLDRCLDTLVKQTIDSLEIIAVNDGSPDDTGQRLDEWASRYPERVKVIHKKNGGCASARNAGLKAARGEFVAFVDADDWVDHQMFEELYRAAVLNSVDVSQCGYAEVFEDSGRIEKYPTAWGGSEHGGVAGIVGDPKSHLIVKPTIWRRIYRKSFLDAYDIGFAEHLRRFDDLPFQFEVLSRINSMAIIPECYYFYRQEREGQDIAVRDHRLFVHFPIFKVLFERVSIWADAEIERNLLRCKLNTHLWALGRIEKKFYFSYLKQASLDICKNNFHHGAFSLLRNAKEWGAGVFLLALISVGLARFVREEEIPCN